MECPYTKTGCTEVDTSGMDKIDCRDCEKAVLTEEDQKKIAEIDDWNTFMMGL